MSDPTHDAVGNRNPSVDEWFAIDFADGSPAAWKAVVTKQAARIAELEKALKPFAEMSKVFSRDDWKDTSYVSNPFTTSKGRFALTVGDLRNALTTLEASERGGGE